MAGLSSSHNQFINRLLGEAALSLESITDHDHPIPLTPLTEIIVWLRRCQGTIHRRDGMWPELKHPPGSEEQPPETPEPAASAPTMQPFRVALAMDILKLPNISQALSNAAEAVLLECLGYDSRITQATGSLTEVKPAGNPGDPCPTCGSPRCPGAPRFKGICNMNKQRRTDG